MGHGVFCDTPSVSATCILCLVNVCMCVCVEYSVLCVCTRKFLYVSYCTFVFNLGTYMYLLYVFVNSEGS